LNTLNFAVDDAAATSVGVVCTDPSGFIMARTTGTIRNASAASAAMKRVRIETPCSEQQDVDCTDRTDAAVRLFRRRFPTDMPIPYANTWPAHDK
jgi:hypothetical protein